MKNIIARTMHHNGFTIEVVYTVSMAVVYDDEGYRVDVGNNGMFTGPNAVKRAMAAIDAAHQSRKRNARRSRARGHQGRRRNHTFRNPKHN